MDSSTSGLSLLREEFSVNGIGRRIYSEVQQIVQTAIIGGNYPVIYSPTGKWDGDAFSMLANDFVMEKLYQKGYIAYLLQSSPSIKVFRKSVESVFINFLISRKKRTVLDNLFKRVHLILSKDNRFKCFIPSAKKALSQWGLSSWDRKEVYNNSEENLVKAGLVLDGFKVIVYELDARKISPVIPDKDLGNFAFLLFSSIDATLNLSQILTVLKYRFNLVEVTEVSLEKPITEDDDGNIFTIGDTLTTQEKSSSVLEIEEAANEVIQLLSSRQKKILTKFQEPDATLFSIGEYVGCSKSTVDNELRRICSSIESVTNRDEQTHAVYRRITEILEEKN